MTTSGPTIAFGYPTPAHGRIPAFHSADEEAVFWDTRDITDFLDDSTRVEITVGQELAERRKERLRREEEAAAGSS